MERRVTFICGFWSHNSSMFVLDVIFFSCESVVLLPVGGAMEHLQPSLLNRARRAYQILLNFNTGLLPLRVRLSPKEVIRQKFNFWSYNHSCSQTNKRAICASHSSGAAFLSIFVLAYHVHTRLCVCACVHFIKIITTQSGCVCVCVSV